MCVLAGLKLKHRLNINNNNKRRGTILLQFITNICVRMLIIKAKIIILKLIQKKNWFRHFINSPNFSSAIIRTATGDSRSLRLYFAASVILNVLLKDLLRSYLWGPATSVLTSMTAVHKEVLYVATCLQHINKDILIFNKRAFRTIFVFPQLYNSVLLPLNIPYCAWNLPNSIIILSNWWHCFPTSPSECRFYFEGSFWLHLRVTR